MGKLTKEVLDLIRKKAEELQRAPLRQEVNYYGTYQGGFHNAVLKAGLCPYDGNGRDRVRPPQNGVCYTDKELLEFIHAYVREYGETPSKEDIPEYGFIEYRFGAWWRVMNELGYSYEQKNPFKPVTRKQFSHKKYFKYSG